MIIRFFLILTTVFLMFTAAQAQQRKSVYIIEIKGVIGPATSDYFRRSLDKAVKNGAQFVVIRMDTPGGLGTAMREIIQDILKSPIPIAGFVSPSGARAASAGTFILYATHISAMAPGTNLGAATPVQVGGSPIPAPGSTPGKKEDDDKKKEDKKKSHPTLKDKSINDSVAYIRSLAELRNRNVEWAGKAVSEAASISSREALKLNVIDLTASDLSDLLKKIDGRKVVMSNGTVTLDSKELQQVIIKPDWRYEFLGIITDPNIAYLLMLIGFYGLILEFYSPGLIGPGIIGAISLLLAFYAFNVLPINYAALGLLLLGILFMVLEAYSPSFGILGLGGAVSFIIGSIMLIDTDVEGFSISLSLIASVGALLTGVFLFAIVAIGTSRRRGAVMGLDNMAGSHGEVIEWSNGSGRIQLQGSAWDAKGAGEYPPGCRVRVTAMEGLVLIVQQDT